MLTVLHFTDNCSSFSYSYIAAEVPFQCVKKSPDCMVFTKVVSINIDSSKSIGGLQPTSRDTDNNAAMYNCWWTNKRNLLFSSTNMAAMT